MSFYSWSRDPDISSANPDIEKIRKRYPEKLKGINWDDPVEVKKNFDDYNAVFWSAHIFCRHSALGILQSSNMTPPLPGAKRYDPGAHSLGNVYELRGKGDTRFGSEGAGISNW